jgi:hypothetical protein
MNRSRAIRLAKLGALATTAGILMLAPELLSWAGHAGPTIIACVLVLLSCRLKVDSWPMTLALAAVPAIHLGLSFALAPASEASVSGALAEEFDSWLPLLITVVAMSLGPIMVMAPILAGTALYAVVRYVRRKRAPAVPGAVD